MIDFLGIGAQKAATTWIYQHLSRHPQICFPAGKEIHFWDHYRNNGVDWWTSLFADNHPGRKQGEITPAYATLDEVTVREIAQLLPDLCVFYSLRNPIARAWSSALMALARAEMEIADASLVWFLDHFKSAGSRRHGDYTSCIMRWRSIISSDRFFIILFDDIVRTPASVLTELCRHIGVDMNWFTRVPLPHLAKPVFPGPGYEVPEPLLDYLRIAYRPMIDSLCQMIGRDLSSWLEWDGKPVGARCSHL
jgi:hypothetical protein